MSKAFHQSIADRIARHHDDRNAFRDLLGSLRRLCSVGDDNVRLESGQFGRECGEPVHSVIEPPLDEKVLAFDIAQFTQPFSEGLLADLRGQHSDAPFTGSGLLRLRRKRRYQRRCTEKRDELAPLHSITSSARASRVGGTARPRAMAVLRLIASSYLVGACTGRSPGFAPLRMRSTYDADGLRRRPRRRDRQPNDCCWHGAADPGCPLTGRYRGQSGHWPTMSEPS